MVMEFELYRLDEPSEVPYTVKATSPQVALSYAFWKASKANEPFMFSKKLLTAVTAHGVLGVRRKVV